MTAPLPPYRPETARTRRGLRIIRCGLFNGKPHGGHTYYYGDTRTCCPGLSEDDL